MEALPTRKIFGVLKLFTLVIIVFVLLGLSLFAGLMIATAGIAIYPPLTKVTAPLACNGEFTIESKTYSKYPGEKVVTNTFYCQQAGSATKTDISMHAALIVFGVYSASIFIVLLVATIVITGSVYLVIRLYSKTTPRA